MESAAFGQTDRIFERQDQQHGRDQFGDVVRFGAREQSEAKRDARRTHQTTFRDGAKEKDRLHSIGERFIFLRIRSLLGLARRILCHRTRRIHTAGDQMPVQIQRRVRGAASKRIQVEIDGKK